VSYEIRGTGLRPRFRAPSVPLHAECDARAVNSPLNRVAILGKVVPHSNTAQLVCPLLVLGFPFGFGRSFAVRGGPCLPWTVAAKSSETGPAMETRPSVDKLLCHRSLYWVPLV
jgi:hypothetical protein